MSAPVAHRALCSASRSSSKILGTSSSRTILFKPFYRSLSSYPLHPNRTTRPRNQPLSPHRPFSTTPVSFARGSSRPSRPTIRSRAQPASHIRMAEEERKMLAAGHTPDEVGLLDGHFITPRFSQWPKTSPRGLYVLARTWLVARLRATASLLMLKWHSPEGFLRHRTQRRAEIARVAAALYTDVYDGFARANLEGPRLEGKLCPGFMGSLKMRIHGRGEREAERVRRWKLVRMVEKPKLVSYLVAMMPGGMVKGAPTAFVQAVVRIRTLQAIGRVKTVSRRVDGKLTTVRVPVDAEGRELEKGSDEDLTKENAKEMLEYFVLQKTVKKGKEGEWMAWGMAKEQDVDELLQTDRERRAAKKRTRALRKELKSQTLT